VTGYHSGGKSVGFESAGDANLELELAWYDGWSEDLTAIRKIANLPKNARVYVEALQRALGVPIDGVSVGPERSAMAQP